MVGHEIDADELEVRTDIWALDGGARVRVCLEHGAPIAIVQAPDAGDPERVAGESVAR